MEEAEKYAKLLVQISSEMLSPKDFLEYIEDYYKNPDEFDIDIDSEYYEAIEYAWLEICCKSFTSISPIYKYYKAQYKN